MPPPTLSRVKLFPARRSPPPRPPPERSLRRTPAELRADYFRRTHLYQRCWKAWAHKAESNSETRWPRVCATAYYREKALLSALHALASNVLCGERRRERMALAERAWVRSAMRRGLRAWHADVVHRRHARRVFARATLEWSGVALARFFRFWTLLPSVQQAERAVTERAAGLVWRAAHLRRYWYAWAKLYVPECRQVRRGARLVRDAWRRGALRDGLHAWRCALQNTAYMAAVARFTARSFKCAALKRLWEHMQFARKYDHAAEHCDLRMRRWALHALTEGVEAQKQMNANFDAAVAHFDLVLRARAMSSWRDFVVRARLDHYARAHHSSRLALKCVHEWARYTLHAQRMRTLMLEAVMHGDARLVECMWRRWQKYVTCRHQAYVHAAGMVLKCDRRVLCESVGKWVRYVAHRVRHYDLLEDMDAHFRDACRRRMLCTWHKFAERKYHNRVVQRRVVRLWAGKVQAMCFATWADTVRALVSHRECHHVLLQAVTRQMYTSALDVWTHHVDAARRTSTALLFWCGTTQRCYFKHWRAYLGARRDKRRSTGVARLHFERAAMRKGFHRLHARAGR